MIRLGPFVLPLLGVVTAGCTPAASEKNDVTVVRGPLLETIEISGTIVAAEADEVGPPQLPDVWNYKISMMAPEGESVSEGAPVVGFDASELEQKLEARVSERDAAAVQLDLERAAIRVARRDEELALAEAEATLRKAGIKADVPPGLTSSIDVAKAQLDLELARLEVEHLRGTSAAATRRDASRIAYWQRKHDRAEQQVASLHEAIERMTVAAPKAGTVIVSTSDEGEKKKVGDSVWRAETILQVASLDRMNARGQIDEVDIARVEVGHPVSLTLDAQTDLELQGVVASISHTVRPASATNPLRVAEIDVELGDSGGIRTRPGMRFRGTIQIARHDDALLVPLDVVVPTTTGPVVHRREHDGWRATPVKLGPRNGESIVVEEGLLEGDHVVRIEEVEG